MISQVRDRLPSGYDVETHFTPSYRPWRQRIAFVPDGDLFAAISSGKASMVTGEIKTFTEDGILLMSGADTVTYRGMMFTGVPNLAWIFGYFRASWTLRADLVSDLVCRLLIHMTELGVSRVTPRLRPKDADMPIRPWVDPENFNPGYLMRSMDLLPSSGDKPEWQHSQDYWSEKDLLPNADLDDGCLTYE